MRNASVGRFGVAGLAAALIAGPAAAQDASIASQTSPAETIQLEEEAQQRLTVPIRIDGKGPYPFVVDTGAERTVISSELARQLSLESGGSVRLHSMSGASRVETALIPELQISRRRISDVAAPLLHEQHIGASGILGIDALRSQRVDFDFQKQTMKIVPSRTSSATRSGDEIVVTAYRRLGRLIMTDAELDGEKVAVIVDTGSAISVANDALRHRLARKGKLKSTRPVELISVTGGVVAADYAILSKMRLGRVTLKEMPIAFARVHPFEQLKLNDRPAMLLGMDVLSLFSRVSIDFARRQVHFLLPDLSMWQEIRLAGGRTGPIRKTDQGAASLRPLR